MWHVYKELCHGFLSEEAPKDPQRLDEKAPIEVRNMWETVYSPFSILMTRMETNHTNEMYVENNVYINHHTGNYMGQKP